MAGKSKRQRQLERVAARRMQAWNAHKNGQDKQAVADEWGVGIDTIRDDVKKVIEKMNRETMASAAEYKRVQLERLQEALGAIWNKVIKGDIPAIQTFIRLLQEEAKITGTYAPTRIDIEERIRSMAREEGLDPDEAVREAERVVRETVS